MLMLNVDVDARVGVGLVLSLAAVSHWLPLAVVLLLTSCVAARV